MADTRKLDSGAGSPASDHVIASTAIDAAKQVGNELLAAASDGVAALAAEQRGYLADEIAVVGDALRCVGDALDENSGLRLGRYAGDAAARVDEFAQTVRTRPWRQLATDVENLARDWPFAFAASALGVGFLAGRFLLSPPAPPVAAPTGGLPRQNQAAGGPGSADAAAVREAVREDG